MTSRWQLNPILYETINIKSVKVRNNFIQFPRLVFLDDDGHQCLRFLRLMFLENGGHRWPRFLRQLFLDNRCRTSAPTSTINLWSFTPQVTLWFEPCRQAICFYTKKKGGFPFTSFNRLLIRCQLI